MIEFPPQPIPPSEFMESFLPGAFAAVELPEALCSLELEVGVQLEGEGGGEWVLALGSGDLRVASRPRDETSLTLVQSVDDWRGALWEGRGGVIGEKAAALFQPGAAPSLPGRGLLEGIVSPEAVSEMGALDARLRLVVSGGAGGDWRVDFKLGGGSIPSEPTTTLCLAAEDAAALVSGAIDPLEAFVAGRIRVDGDVALLMQLQVIAMQAATPSQR